MVVLPVDDAEDEVEEAEEGTELSADEADAAVEAGATETVDSPADAVEEA